MENIRSCMCLYYQSTDLKIFLFCKLQILLKIYFLPVEKQILSLFTSNMYLHILYTINAFKRNWQRNNIFGRICHCTWFIIMFFNVTESLL